MAMRVLTLPIVLALIGCGSGASDSSEIVQAANLRGLWVFSSPPSNDARAAELRAVPAVSGECLVIGSGIVVWRDTDMDQLALVVDLAKAGMDIEVSVGGDLLRDWASQSSTRTPPMLVPEIIAERCAISDETAIWEASTGPMFD